MPILSLSVGRAAKGPERELIERYEKRSMPLARKLGFGAISIKTIPESRKSSAAARRTEEAERLLKLAPQGVLFALDEKGLILDSSRFARMIQGLRNEGRSEISFVIGGPDGLDDRIKNKAERLIAFGAMTWPHQLAQAMLMEQIYRSLTMLAGHPYHRE